MFQDFVLEMYGHVFFFHCVWSCRFLQVFKVFGIYVLQFVLEVKD